MPLRLVPEVLDPVDMAPLVDEPLRVIDPNMVEVRNVQGIIARKAVRIDDAVRPDHTLHNRHQRGSPGIGNHRRVDLPTSLQKPENRDFSASASTPLAFAAAAKITLINLDLSGKRRGLLHFLGNHLAKPSIKRGRRVLDDATWRAYTCQPIKQIR